MVALHDRVEPDGEVVLTELHDGEAVLLHLHTKMYYSLNASGLQIWRLISAGLSLAEASARLQDEYDVTAAAAGESVAHLVAALGAERLVKIL